MENNNQFILKLQAGQTIKINNLYKQSETTAKIIKKNYTGILIEREDGTMTKVLFQSAKYMRFKDDVAYFMIGQYVSFDEARIHRLDKDYWMTLEILDEVEE